MIFTAHAYAPNGQRWGGNNQWSVNLYSDGISPAPYTVYVDDARIAIP